MTLFVDLQTDYVPTVEFQTIDIAVVPEGTSAELQSSATAESANDYLEARRASVPASAV